MSAELEPPDLARCQAEVIENRPFVMGGPVRRRVRCENAPTWLAKETQPAEDGLMGSMTLCQPCKEVCERKLGGKGIVFEPIIKKAEG